MLNQASLLFTLLIVTHCFQACNSSANIERRDVTSRVVHLPGACSILGSSRQRVEGLCNENPCNIRTLRIQLIITLLLQLSAYAHFFRPDPNL